MSQALPTNALPGLAQSVTNQLHDIKPPVHIPNGWAWLWGALGALGLAAVLVWSWSYWNKRRKQVPVVPPVPPHITAKQRLEQALSLLGQPKEFCIAVSDIVRWYLEVRFDFRAPDRTSEEFLTELQSTSLLNQDQKSSLGDFLLRCDLVKFAKYEPMERELRDLHGSAVRLVNETEPPPAAAEIAVNEPVSGTPQAPGK